VCQVDGRPRVYGDQMTLIEHEPPDAAPREGQSVSVVILVGGRACGLTRTLRQLPPWVGEVVVVDERSSLGAIATAHGDCVVALRADGHVEAAEIARFVRALRAGGARWPQAA
jgi:hypothetical protein